MMSKAAIGIAAGICGTIFLGYCVYFDHKRRGDPNFKRKLKEISILQRWWNSIWSSYARQVRLKKGLASGSGASNRRTYTYFEQLGFLNMTSKKSSGSLEEDENAPEDDSDDSSFGSIETEKRPRALKKKINHNSDDELIEILKKKAAIEEMDNKDEDRHFFLSLLSEMKKVPAENKLELRSRIISEVAQAQKPTDNSHPNPPHLLDLRRKAKEIANSRSGPRTKLPDMKDPEAVQCFFLKQIQMGEELLGQGDVDGAVDYLCNAVIVCGQPNQLMQVLQQTLPPQAFTLLAQRLPQAYRRVGVAEASSSPQMAEEDVE